MKNSIKVCFFTILFATISILSLSAQDITQISKRKNLRFDKEIEPVEMIINIGKDYNILRINIELSLLSGAAKCEILDPKGKEQGKFTIETDNRTKNGQQTTTTNAAVGSLQKSFRNPLHGNWKIKITPSEAIVGGAQIKYNQIYNPKADLLELENIDEINEIKVNKEK